MLMLILIFLSMVHEYAYFLWIHLENGPFIAFPLTLLFLLFYRWPFPFTFTGLWRSVVHSFDADCLFKQISESIVHVISCPDFQRPFSISTSATVTGLQCAFCRFCFSLKRSSPSMPRTSLQQWVFICILVYKTCFGHSCCSLQLFKVYESVSVDASVLILYCFYLIIYYY